MKLVTEIAYKMAFEENLEIKYFYIHSGVDAKVHRGSKVAYTVSQFLVFNFLWIHKLCRIYHLKKADIIFSNYFRPGFAKPGLATVSSKEAILQIKYKNIPVGELIYDTYLRFRSKSGVDIKDECLTDIILYSEKMIDRWQEGLDKYKIRRMVLPYVAYHHWGIPAYTCLHKGIEVVTFGAVNYVFSKPTLSHPYHSKNFHTYPHKFSLVSNKAEKIYLAKDVLQKRLSGVVDVGTAYMKQSAFSDMNDANFSPSENSNWCVVFLHCFFDSPHIYGKSLFPDFHEWVIHILQHATKNTGTYYYIKEHPNALPENRLVVDSIKERYSQNQNIIFLPGYISNKQIAAKKPKAIFTVYGTVAHEFAALKIPVVVAGKNPQSMYGFIYKPETITDFDKYLDSIGLFGLPEEYRENDIYEFFYMHYLFYSAKYDSSNFDKQLDLINGKINLPVGIPFSDLLF